MDNLYLMVLSGIVLWLLWGFLRVAFFAIDAYYSHAKAEESLEEA